MGPQEHAFRSGVDVIVATPGRLLDHFKQPYAKLTGSRCSCSTKPTACSTWASCPTSGASSSICRQAADAVLLRDDAARRSSTLTREMLHNPATINLERKSAPAIGITQAVYPVPQELKPPLLVELLQAGDDPGSARLHAHEASRQSSGRLPRANARSARRASTATARRRSAPRRWTDSRTARYTCSSRPTSPRAASTSRRSDTS